MKITIDGQNKRFNDLIHRFEMIIFNNSNNQARIITYRNHFTYWILIFQLSYCFLI